MVMKFNPQGLVTMVLGRKDEAVDYIERFLEEGRKVDGATLTAPGSGAGRGGTFGRPTDVAFDTQGNIFVADGYTNSRVAKFSKDGDFIKSIGKRGNQPGEFSTPHTIANDAKGNIYVGDRGNSRIQVFDPELNPVRIISNVRAPWGICISPPNAQGQQFLFSADAGGKIYKTDLEGHLLGWFGEPRQERRPVLLGARDALRQRHRTLRRRGPELARAEDHAEGHAEVVGKLTSATPTEAPESPTPPPRQWPRAIAVSSSDRTDRPPLSHPFASASRSNCYRGGSTSDSNSSCRATMSPLSPAPGGSGGGNAGREPADRSSSVRV